jgi:hypothetical protein
MSSVFVALRLLQGLRNLANPGFAVKACTDLPFGAAMVELVCLTIVILRGKSGAYDCLTLSSFLTMPPRDVMRMRASRAVCGIDE